MGCLRECCCGYAPDLNRNKMTMTTIQTTFPTKIPAEFSAHSGKKAGKWWQKLMWTRREKKMSAEVYYVKGSRIPVESLDSELNCHDSRFYYPRRQHNSATHAGNPSLLFLMNWQVIPPLSRLAVLQRAAYCRTRSLLPVIREVPAGQEGGDSRQRGRNVTTPRMSRWMLSGGEEERMALELQAGSTPVGHHYPVPVRRGHSTTAVASVCKKSRSSCWLTKSQC